MLTAATFPSSPLITILGFGFVFLGIAVVLTIWGVAIYLVILIIQALRKYLASGNVRRENAAAFLSLGEALKTHRMSLNMTQEFVAEHLGVSRQAVSKWENGTSDPSTSNLLALCKLYGISAADLLKEVQL